MLRGTPGDSTIGSSSGSTRPACSRDLDSLEPGADFADVIEETVARCDALLAVIGREWLATADRGRRRLDEPQDWVRLEIGNALKRNIRVVPVLVAGGRMPSAADLPEELRPLARRHAVELSESAWAAQVGQLIDRLERPARTAPGAASERRDAGAGGVAVGGSIKDSAVIIGDHNVVRRGR